MSKYTGLVLGLALAGCGGEAVDLGANGEQASLEGEWVGSLRSYLFVGCEEGCSSLEEWLPPRTLRLTLDSAGHGSLLVGDTALPPPTDSNVGYPPEAYMDAGEATSMRVHLYDGVSYPLENVSRSGDTLHIELDALHSFDAFCALQTPVQWSLDGTYHCLENTAWGVDREGDQKSCSLDDYDTGESKSVDCVVMSLCLGHGAGCVCTASECHAGSTSTNSGGYRVSFDLELDVEQTTLTGPYLHWREDPEIDAALDPHLPAQTVEFWRQ